MQAMPGSIQRGPAWKGMSRGDIIPGKRPPLPGHLIPPNYSHGTIHPKGRYNEAVSSGAFFAILSCTGFVVVIAEVVVILILKRSRLTLSMKILSINFIVSDLLFHLVTGGTSVARFVTSRQSIVHLKIARQFLMGFTSSATFGAVTLMVLERTIAMTWPFYHKTYATKFRTCLAVATVWLINSGAYCGSILLYVFGCGRLADALCIDDGNRIERFRSYMSLTETTMLLILVSVYDVVYVVACSVLAFQIASFIRRQQLRQRIRFSATSAVTSTRDTSVIKLSISESVETENVFSKENTMGDSAILASSVGPSSSNTVNAATDPVQRCRRSPVVSESGTSAQSNLSLANRINKSASTVLLKDTAKVSMIVLVVALLQLIMHMPFIIKLFLIIFQQTDKHSAVGYQYLEVISLCLLQICTIPNMYLYVLKLQSCKEQAKKLLCASWKVFFCKR